MKHPLIQKALPHLAALGIALAVVLLYFSPLLSGKVLKQHDIDQWRASHHETEVFQKTSGERTFWTNSVFSGMPTYLIGPEYRNNFTSTIQDLIITTFKSPVDTMLILFVSFYVLLLVFNVNHWLAVAGALAFMLSSFNLINIDAGHLTKGNAIAYMPLVLAGIEITLRKNKWLGAVVTGLAMSLQLTAGHLQITYYLMLMIGIWMVAEIVRAVMQKQLVQLVVCGLLLAVAAGLGVATNATNLMATREYGEYSIRGKSELTHTPDGKSNETVASSGLDKDYALQWSNGTAEPFTLLIPNFYGGASSAALSTSSETYEVLKKNGVPNAKQIIQNMPVYWGTQPFTAGPIYYGALICYLFVLGLLLVKGPEKWWILAISALAIALSMGKNWMWLTDLFFYHMPLYNKFRSVTFILAITQLTFPFLGILALRDMMNGSLTKATVQKALLRSLYIVGGICLVFALMPEVFFNLFGIAKGEKIDDYFISMADAQLPEWVREALVNDRKSLLRLDAIRSLVFVVLGAGALWFYVAGKLKQPYLIGALIALIVVDLWQVDKRYLNDKDFTSKKKNDQPVFAKTQADELILRDTSLSYRVYNTTQRLDQDAFTSYYHKSIGGYHGAKMRRYQELIEFQLSRNNFSVINMLNVKYFVVADSNNNTFPQLNTEACGNAWFVPRYVVVPNADAEIDSLTQFNPREVAYIDARYQSQLNGFSPVVDSAASIVLTKSKPNELVYQSQAATEQVAVFSEIFYDKGWNVRIDGVPAEHFRCNYVLRGMKVPAGSHTITFAFEPQVIKDGERISLVSSVLLYGGLLVVGLMGFIPKKNNA